MLYCTIEKSNQLRAEGFEAILELLPQVAVAWGDLWGIGDGPTSTSQPTPQCVQLVFSEMSILKLRYYNVISIPA